MSDTGHPFVIVIVAAVISGSRLAGSLTRTNGALLLREKSVNHMDHLRLIWSKNL